MKFIGGRLDALLLLQGGSTSIGQVNLAMVYLFICADLLHGSERDQQEMIDVFGHGFRIPILALNDSVILLINILG